jgi:uncharacterized protein
VRALGFRVLRVRHHGELGRLELDEPELRELWSDRARRAAVEAAIRSAGYLRAQIDERPFRSGSLNALIAIPHPHDHGSRTR